MVFKSKSLQIQVDIAELTELKKSIYFLDSPKKLLQKISKGIYEELQRTTPVDTGYLRSRWRIGEIEPAKPSIDGGYGFKSFLNNDTYYCDYVNYGHRAGKHGYVPGQYFIQKAVEEYSYKELKTLVH